MNSGPWPRSLSNGVTHPMLWFVLNVLSGASSPPKATLKSTTVRSVPLYNFGKYHIWYTLFTTMFLHPVFCATSLDCNWYQAVSFSTTQFHSRGAEYEKLQYYKHSWMSALSFNYTFATSTPPLSEIFILMK